MTDEELRAAEQLEAAAIAAAESDGFGDAAALYRQMLETYPGLPGEAQRNLGWNLGLMYRAAGHDELATTVFEHYGFDPDADTNETAGSGDTDDTPGFEDGSKDAELPIDPQAAGDVGLLAWTGLYGKAAAVRSLGAHRERAQLVGDNVVEYLNNFVALLPDDEWPESAGYRSGLASALAAFQQANLELTVAIDGCVSALAGDKHTAMNDAFDRVVGAYGHRDKGFVKAIADLETAIRETVDPGLTAYVKDAITAARMDDALERLHDWASRLEARVTAMEWMGGIASAPAFAGPMIAAGVGVGGRILFPAVGKAVTRLVTDIEATSERKPRQRARTSLRKGVISKVRHAVGTGLGAGPVSQAVDRADDKVPEPIGNQLRLYGKVIDVGQKLLEDHHQDVDELKSGDRRSQVEKLVQALQQSHEHNRVEFEAMGDFTVDDHDPHTGDYRVTLSTGGRGRLVKQQHYRFVVERSGSQMLDDSQKHRIRLAAAWLDKHWPDRLGEPPRDSASEISWNLDGVAFVRDLPAPRPSQQPQLYGNVKLKAVPNYQQIARNPDLLWKQPCFGSFTLSLIVYPDGSCSAPTEDLGEAYLLKADGMHHESVEIENVDVLVVEQQARRGWANVARGHLEYHYAHSETVAARNWTLISDDRYTIDAIYREHWDGYKTHLDTPFDTWMALNHIAHHAHERPRHHEHHEHRRANREHQEQHGHQEHHGHQEQHGRRRHGHDRHQSHQRHQELHKDGQFDYGYRFAFADYPKQAEEYDREYSGIDGTTLWEFIKAVRTTIDEIRSETVERRHALVLVQLHDDTWYASVYADETDSHPVVQYRAAATAANHLSEVEEALEITIEESDSE
jgi:hypothetical protein